MQRPLNFSQSLLKTDILKPSVGLGVAIDTVSESAKICRRHVTGISRRRIKGIETHVYSSMT